jgi:hypothetical protein
MIRCLRILASLRRIARALERQADALETLARIATDEWARAKRVAPARPTEFASLDIAEANKRWHQQEQAAGREEPV